MQVGSKLRILIAHSFYRVPGGEDTYVRAQAKLLGRNHDIDLLEERNEDLAANLQSAMRMVFSPSKKREVAQRIERFRPDLIHIHNVYPSLGPAVHLAAAEARIPIVMTVHNYRLLCPNGYRFTEGSTCDRCARGMYAHAVLHECFPSFRQSAAYASSLWVHRFVLRLGNKVGAFVAPSEFVGGWLVNAGIAAHRVSVVPNFVQPTPNPSPRAGEYGVYVGRLSSEKGLDVMLRALAIAGDPPFRLVGDGPQENEIRVLVGRLGLRNTTLAGRLRAEEVESVLRGARYLVMPAIWHENCPMAVIEAMSLGRPLLVTDRGGLPELVRKGNGLMCPASDPHEMARAMRHLMEDNELCEEAGARSLAYYKENFTPAIHLSRLESVYRECVAALVNSRTRGDYA